MMGQLLDEALGRPQAAPAAAPTAGGAGVDLGRIQNDPAFRRMDPAGQQKILQSLGVQPAQDPGGAGSDLARPATTAPTPIPAAPKDMPMESAVPGELKKALIDPTYRLATHNSAGWWETAADTLSTAQVVGAGAMMATRQPLHAGSMLLAPVVGATVKGLLTDFNAAQGWTGFLGGLAEIGVGMAQGMSGWREAMSTARGLTTEARAGGAIAGSTIAEGAGSVMKRQNIAEAVISRANQAFQIRGAPISRVIDGLESTASKIKLTRDNPAYADVEFLVSKAKEMRVHAPELASLEKQLETGTVNVKDVVELRKGLEGDLSYARSALDPNVPANAKLSMAVRGYATEAITTALGNEAGGRYGEALLAWKTQVSDPKRIIEAIRAKNLEPSTAFEMMYGGSAKPEVFQTLAQLRDVDPTLRSTLRLGAMQHFYAAAGGDLRRSAAAAKEFERLGPMLGTTGLFNHEELTSLKLFMKPGAIDAAMSNLGQLVSGPKGRVVALGIVALGGGQSGSAIYHLLANHPQLGFMAIAASGGLTALRRATLAPPGSAVAAAAGTAIVRGLADMGRSLAARPSANLAK